MCVYICISVCLVLWKWHGAKFYISFLNYMAFLLSLGNKEARNSSRLPTCGDV